MAHNTLLPKRSKLITLGVRIIIHTLMRQISARSELRAYRDVMRGIPKDNRSFGFVILLQT
jgi:hypothetical protein